MMKRYQITVNGMTYTVDVDEVDMEQEQDREALETPLPLPVDIRPARGSGKRMVPVINPMDCEIKEIRVKKGQVVAEGDIVAVVRVMDIENELPAPDGGEVTRIFVAPGEKVSAGTTLIEIH